MHSRTACDLTLFGFGSAQRRLEAHPLAPVLLPMPEDVEQEKEQCTQVPKAQGYLVMPRMQELVEKPAALEGRV
jgi:hypothetical protein